MKETKREKFVRLAEKRIDNVLKGINLLENLANHNVYEFTKEDSDKMIRTLKSAVSDLERAYNASEKPQKFKL